MGLESCDLESRDSLRHVRSLKCGLAKGLYVVEKLLSHGRIMF